MVEVIAIEKGMEERNSGQSVSDESQL